MKCPRCGHDFGDSLVPVCCPDCGYALSTGSHESLVPPQTKTTSAPMSKGHALIAISVVACLIALVIFVAYNLGLWGGTTLDNVEGWAASRAQARLEQEGFAVTTEERFDSVAAGMVISQEPAAGSRVRSGAKVHLVVSKAKTMPKAIGEQLKSVTDALDAMEVSYEIDERYDDVQKDTILDTSVPEGNALGASTKVKLVVARSRTIPDLANKSLSQATALLDECGLKAHVVYVSASNNKEGTVVSTEPASGTEVKKDQVVEVRVAASYLSSIEKTAQEILQIIYGTDPLSGDYAIGEKLKPYLSSQVRISGREVSSASNKEVYFGVVKAGHSLPSSVPQELGMLSRSLASTGSASSTQTGEADKLEGTVVIEATVNWDWSRLGEGYKNVSSTDTHTATMRFDSEGKLLSFSDPQGDVPAYELTSLLPAYA